MKKDKKKSGSKRRSLLATGIASLALLATVATATYAWFSINTTVTVGVSSLEAVAGDNIDISSDGSSWGSSVSLTLDEMNSTVTDISGDGKTFYNKAGNESTDYVEFTLQFRASSYYKIFLNSNSRVVPHDPNGNKSTYGNYSKDNIAAAVRVAFLFNDEVQLVWAPNSDYTLTKSGDTYSLSTTDTTSTKTYPYRNSPDTTAEGLFRTSDPNFLATTSTEWDQQEVIMYNQNKNALATIVPSSPGVLDEVEIVVRIWLEGEDPECANPFLGGIFDTTLSFSAEALTQGTRPTVSAESIVSGSGIVNDYQLNITGAESGDKAYEISLDGKTYIDYISGTPLKSTGLANPVNKEIYVREKATTAAGGIPSSATRVLVGKYGQAAPDQGLFTTVPETRTLKAASNSTYLGNDNGAKLEYSTDGVRYNPFSADVVVTSMAKRDYYIRYAAVGDYDASNYVVVPMKGKEVAPTKATIVLAGEGQPLMTITAGLEYELKATAFSAAPTSTDVSTGVQIDVTSYLTGNTTGYIAVRRPSSNIEDSVHSDWVYFTYDVVTGTVTQVAAPTA